MNRLLSVFAFFLLLACSQPQNAHFNSLEFIPENAEIILQSPELEKFLQSAEENKFLKQEPLFTKLKGQLEFLRFYQIAGRSLLSLSGLNKDKPEIVLASESIDYRISLDSIKNKQLETITQNSISFQKATLENSSFYLYQEGKLAVFSNRAASLISLISEKNILQTLILTRFLKLLILKNQCLHSEYRLSGKLQKFLAQGRFPGSDTLLELDRC